MRSILLLVCSNAFMTVAWYWQLIPRGDGQTLGRALTLPALVLVSWLIALPEYALAVPANRLGHVANGGAFTAPQLKILQEGISVAVFLAFSLIALREVPRWQDLVAFLLIGIGLAVALLSRSDGAVG